MKLRLESLEFDQTFTIKVPNSCSLQQLINTLSHNIASSSSSSSSLHLSLNRKDEIRASSPHDSLHSLGMVDDDLIFYSLNPTAFSLEILAGDAPSTPAVEKHPTLGGLDLPPCFMELPMELKGLILGRVPGVDLGKVACTCSELRFLCSDNELLKKKYLEKFGGESISFQRLETLFST
ncbi:hypothetical protein VNO80_06095 [Phaseolus coccineus]|uniref:F-box domain-containing protein n=1 Tax=Phaseolus coccineus TaxID=3886 RepID=A0AAN9RNK7_PHACN